MEEVSNRMYAKSKNNNNKLISQDKVLSQSSEQLENTPPLPEEPEDTYPTEPPPLP